MNEGFLLMRLILRYGKLKVKAGIFLLAFFFYSILLTAPAIAITIAVEPSAISVANEGEVFSVKIMLKDHAVQNDVFALDFRLKYDPQYLKFVNIGGVETTVVQSSLIWKGGYIGTIDSTAGIIDYSGVNMTFSESNPSCLNQGITESFPVTLAEFYFQAVKSGKTNVNFDTSVNPLEVFNSPTVAYVYSVEPTCAGAVIPTPQNAEVKIGDFSPPVVSDVKVSKITRSTATITWTTNENTTSQIQYGLTQALGINSPMQDTSVLVSTHSLTLTGLSRETTYYYKVISVDAAGNVGPSDVKSFKTNLVDETPPVITHEQVLYATESVPQTVTATIVDDDTNNLPSASLYYKRGDETQFNKVSMTTANSVDFTGVIPAESVTVSDVNYYIEAADVSLNKSVSPDNAPGSPYLIQVTSSQSVDLATVSGTVYTDTAKTKAEPEVKIRVKGLGVSVKTDNNGKYTLSNLPKPKVEPFIYTIEASKEGFMTAENTYNFAFPSDAVDFVLQKSGTISGVVYNSRTCVPVPLMVVSLKDEKGSPFDAYTDISGNYKKTNFALGTYTVNFRKIGYKESSSATAACPGITACTDATLVFADTADGQNAAAKTCNFLAVPKPIATISVNPSDIFVAPGDKIQFTASLATEDGENASLLLNPALTWDVSTPLLGEVTAGGEFIAANQSITGFVQVSAEGVSGISTVNVRKELSFRSIFNEIKPFNPRKLENGIEIRYELTQDPYIVLVKIYTMTGRIIRTLQGEKGADPSTGTAVWDGKDDFGNEVYNGVYIYQIMAQNKNGTAYSRPKPIAIMK